MNIAVRSLLLESEETDSGINWTANGGTDDNGWTSIAYGNGRFVAVANSGTNRVMTSDDLGKTWSARNAAEANQWRSICFSQDLNLFCAVAISGTNRVMTSPDGITWTARAASVANQWAAVCWGNGLFVATAISGTNRIMTSPDGTTWTTRTGNAALNYFDVAWGNGLFIAVAAGSTGNNAKFMRSTDGFSWTTYNVTTQQFLGIKWISFLNKWVAVAGDGTNRISISSDGITFTPVVSDSTVQWEKLDFSSSLIVVVGSTSGTSRILISYDASDWDLMDTPALNNWLGVAYGGGAFVAVANSGVGNRVMTSP